MELVGPPLDRGPDIRQAFLDLQQDKRARILCQYRLEFRLLEHMVDGRKLTIEGSLHKGSIQIAAWRRYDSLRNRSSCGATLWCKKGFDLPQTRVAHDYAHAHDHDNAPRPGQRRSNTSTAHSVRSGSA